MTLTRETATRHHVPRGAIVAIVVLSVLLVATLGGAGFAYWTITQRDQALLVLGGDLDTQTQANSDLQDAFDACSAARDDAVNWIGQAQEALNNLRRTGYWGWTNNIDQVLGYGADVDDCQAP